MPGDFARFREDDDGGPVKAKVRPKAKVELVKDRYTKKDLILAVDQSLAASGWVLIRGDLCVVTVGTLKKSKDTTLDGHEAMLQRVVALEEEAEAVLREIKPMIVLHESPPVGNFRGSNQSSLVAAVAWRIAAAKVGLPIKMVGAQKAKKHLTGNGNAKKPAVHAALREQIAQRRIITPPIFKVNMDILDGLAIAVTEIDGVE